MPDKGLKHRLLSPKVQEDAVEKGPAIARPSTKPSINQSINHHKNFLPPKRVLFYHTIDHYNFSFLALSPATAAAISAPFYQSPFYKKDV
jgi:hypothetical protein